MYVKAQYTVEAALLVPMVILILMMVFTVSNNLYNENCALVTELEGQQELEENPPKALWNSFQKGELTWKLSTDGN